jgi:hypothetical protein
MAAPWKGEGIASGLAMTEKKTTNDTPKGELLLYQTEDGRTRIECRFEGETVWLTQAMMAELFQTTPQNITQHLREIYAEGELDEVATCKANLQVRIEGARQVSRNLRFYNLEAILAVGFRVRSHRGTQFRKWANARLSAKGGPLSPTVPHAPSLPNPILRPGFSGGFISSRMASKTARNWASYFLSRSASLRARSAFCWSI